MRAPSAAARGPVGQPSAAVRPAGAVGAGALGPWECARALGNGRARSAPQPTGRPRSGPRRRAGPAAGPAARPPGEPRRARPLLAAARPPTCQVHVTARSPSGRLPRRREHAPARHERHAPSVHSDEALAPRGTSSKGARRPRPVQGPAARGRTGGAASLAPGAAGLSTTSGAPPRTPSRTSQPATVAPAELEPGWAGPVMTALLVLLVAVLLAGALRRRRAAPHRH